jgi:hypothetical protein
VWADFNAAARSVFGTASRPYNEIMENMSLKWAVTVGSAVGIACWSYWAASVNATTASLPWFLLTCVGVSIYVRKDCI